MVNLVLTSIGGQQYRVEVMRTTYDIRTGMGKYSSPPSHGMLFVLRGEYRTVTMRGVSFPLYVSFFDRQWNALLPSVWMMMHPGDMDRSLPKGTYYMVEYPA